MKKIALFLSAFSLIQSIADAQGLQATLVNGPSPNSVRVRVKNNTASAISGNLVSFTFSLRIPDLGAGNPGITTTSLMVNPGSNANLPAYTDAGYRYYDNFITLNGSNPVSIAAGGELDVFNVAFTGGAGSANVELVAKLQSGPGSAGPNNATEYYVALNTGEITDNSTRFYNNGTNSNGLSNTAEMSVVGLSGIVLPVQYSHLEALALGKNARISWGTVSEQHNLGFDIERSADGKSFQAIGFVASLAPDGNSNQKLTYIFDDESPLPGMNYYRLRQTDRDGKRVYSKVLQVSFGTEDGVRMYPNPAGASTTIAISGAAAIRVYDATGRQLNVPVVYGALSSELQTAALPDGMYAVMVTSERGCRVYKLMIRQ